MKLKFMHIPALVLLLVAVTFGGCAPDNHVKVLYSTDGSEQAADTWHQVQDGLSYANILVDAQDGSRKEFFLVKVDPHLFEFKIYNNTDQKKAKSLQQIHQEQSSVLTFNGAFFDTDFKAMGLLQDSTALSHGQGSSGLMNGIFQVSNTASNPLAQVHSTQNVPGDKQSFMIQNGPVLLDNDGSIPLGVDTGKLAARTVIGVDRDGNVILIVLHQSLINSNNTLSLYSLAHLLKEDPQFGQLGLHSVLNLDGGPSTGVVVGTEYLPEINNVQNAVITLPRQQKL